MTTNAPGPGHILSCDWGTTRFRLRLADPPACNTLDEFRSLDGVAMLAEQYPPEQRALAYQTVLGEGLVALEHGSGERLAGAPIVISGMASSTLGWHELAYARLPFALDGTNFVWRELGPLAGERGSHRVFLLSGIRSETDVLRGEESELVGLFTLPPFAALAERTLVIKPGTHSKHLHVADGKLVDFHTFMTGELYDVLGKHSVLRHSLERGASQAASDAQHPSVELLDDLKAGVRAAAVQPLSSALFQVRTRQVLNEIAGERQRAFLSGVLIGAELAYLAGPNFADWPLVLCATSPLEPHYRAALEELGLAEQTALVPVDDVELLSARGQAAWWRNFSP